MRKLLSVLLILLLPVQGVLGNVMATQMDLSKSPVVISVSMDCDMAGSPADAQDAGQADGCPQCVDCPMCHLVAASFRWSLAESAYAWATPLFMPQPMETLAPLPSLKPPIF